MLKHILFDIDDTLFPSSEFAELARRNAVRAMIRMGLKAEEDGLYARLLAVIGKRGSNYTNHFDDLCASLKVRDSPRFVAAAIAAYHDTKAAIQPYPEAPRVLLKLRDSGYHLYVATNGESVKQWDKLIRLGLALYFRDVFVSSDLGESKGPGFYGKVLKRLGARPGECLMVGDREDSDIRPAKGAGIRAVRIRRGKYSKGKTAADFEVRSLDELLPAIQKL